MFPEHTKVTCSGSDTEHLTKVLDRTHVCQRADGIGSVEVGTAVPPADDDGVDAVFGRARYVVRPVADHQQAVGQWTELGEGVCEDL
jgi:hypothetical protein